MVFEILFVVGAIGFIAMLLMGFGHGSGGHGHGAHAHGSHGHGAHGHGGHHAAGHASHSDSGHGHGHSHDSGDDVFRIPLLFSPMTIFALCLGAGATGLLFRSSVAMPMLGFYAAAGALLINFGIVIPLMNFVQRFVSKPSEGLEGCIGQVATAASRFDASGRGIVNLNLDGQIVRLLGTLPAHEVGTAVGAGSQLILLDVNAEKGTCVVTGELETSTQQELST